MSTLEPILLRGVAGYLRNINKPEMSRLVLDAAKALGPIANADGSVPVSLIASAPALLAMVERYASECEECGGKGFRMTHPAGAIGDCFECADIRALLKSARGNQS